jgi:hypothetical protein
VDSGWRERLMLLLKNWDEYPAERRELNDRIREHLRSLREGDVPPLIVDNYPPDSGGKCPR